MEFPVDDTITKLLNTKLNKIEKQLTSDVIFFYGPISDGFAAFINKVINDMKPLKNKLFFILTTPGGDALEVERAVNVIRHFYSEVGFIVPDYAYSAGTIFCMSGDEIYMSYFGVLGPIDPQVQNKDGIFIPAQGYLTKVEDFINKSANGTLTNAEMMMLGRIDLADLNLYEQARNHTIDLLKKWLVQYKFKNWTTHETHPTKKGQPVAESEKIQRAEEIAFKLSDNKIWRQHGRGINIETLRNELKLKIYDYGTDKNLSYLIENYYNMMMDYVRKNGNKVFTHTRRYI